MSSALSQCVSGAAGKDRARDGSRIVAQADERVFAQAAKLARLIREQTAKPVQTIISSFLCRSSYPALSDTLCNNRHNECTATCD
jgi:hypothetical protein